MEETKCLLREIGTKGKIGFFQAVFNNLDFRNDFSLCILHIGVLIIMFVTVLPEVFHYLSLYFCALFLLEGAFIWGFITITRFATDVTIRICSLCC